MGLGPNLSPYCRWFPGISRGWWAYQAYPQNVPQPMNIMGQPNPGIFPGQAQPYSPYQANIPSPPQQNLYPPQQMPYGQGPFFGQGIGAGFGGLGMGMRHRRRMGGPPSSGYRY
ncbi:MAG: hypothetical protein QXI59_08090 [Candidatus Bathyarchaeia archaeon]